MSEIKHPRFNGENEANVDIKLQFAEEALNLLVNHGVICVTVDETEVVEDAETITPRYDCPTDKPSVFVSVRLRELNQTFAVQSSMLVGPEELLEPIMQKQYTAIVLETAEYNDITHKNLDVESNEIEVWDDYVAIIIETSTYEKNISIVNAATGEELDFEDIMTAYSALSALNAYLLSERFLSYISPEDLGVSDADEVEEQQVHNTEKFQGANGVIREFKEFRPSYYHLDYECAACGNPGPLCEAHANPWKG